MLTMTTTRVARAIARPFVFIFFKIKEPRTIRIIQFGIYATMIGAGHFVVAHPPSIYTSVIGPNLVYGFGIAVLLGGSLGAIAVLPGIWWLERIGIISLWTGLLVFAVLAVALGISLIGFFIAVALGLAFVQRWDDITEYDLAPRAS